MQCRMVVLAVEGILLPSYISDRHLLRGTGRTAWLWRYLSAQPRIERRTEHMYPYLLRQHLSARVGPPVLFCLVNEHHPLLLLDLGNTSFLHQTRSHENPFGFWYFSPRFRPMERSACPHSPGIWVGRVVILRFPFTDQLNSLYLPRKLTVDDPSCPSCSFSFFGQKYTNVCPLPNGVPHSGRTSPRPVRVGKTRYSCCARSRSIKSIDCLGRAEDIWVIHVDSSDEVARLRMNL